MGNAGVRHKNKNCLNVKRSKRDNSYITCMNCIEGSEDNTVSVSCMTCVNAV